MTKGADESLHFSFPVFILQIEKEFPGMEKCFPFLHFLPDLNGVFAKINLHDHVLPFELRRQGDVSVEYFDLAPVPGFPHDAQKVQVRLLQIRDLPRFDIPGINGGFSLGEKPRIVEKVGIVRAVEFGKFLINFRDGGELECLPHLPVEDRVATFHRSVVPWTFGCIEQRDCTVGAQPLDHFPHASFPLDESPERRSIVHLQNIWKR